MKLIFLGTISAVPTLYRNVAAIGLQLEQRSDWWLFDCGEGTQHQILRTNLTLPKMNRIFISHLHGDHCFGLMGLLASRSMQGGTEKVSIYGPKGIKDYVQCNQKITGTRFAFPVEIQEIKTNYAEIEDKDYRIKAVEVKHIGQTLAFIIEEKDKAGKFDVEKAQQLGISPGPIYARLKNGEKIELENGKIIDGSTLVGPTRPGKTLVLVSDTFDASAVKGHLKSVQLLVHEATYISQDIDLAKRGFHSTAADAAKLAREIQAENLILTHFSARYEPNDVKNPKIKDLIQEASNIFPGKVLAARDFMSYKISSML